jgi:hypothetical protein
LPAARGDENAATQEANAPVTAKSPAEEYIFHEADFWKPA